MLALWHSFFDLFRLLPASWISWMFLIPGLCGEWAYFVPGTEPGESAEALHGFIGFNLQPMWFFEGPTWWLVPDLKEMAVFEHRKASTESWTWSDLKLESNLWFAKVLCCTAGLLFFFWLCPRCGRFWALHLLESSTRHHRRLQKTSTCTFSTTWSWCYCPCRMYFVWQARKEFLEGTPKEAEADTF